MRVLGIDLSLSSTAIASAIAGEDALVQRIRTKPVQRIEVAGRDPVRDVRGAIHRYRAIADRIASVARRGAPVDLVLIEGYAFVDSQSGELDRIELGGIVRDRLEGIAPVLEVAPSTLKKFACGKGNAQKDVMVSTLSVQFGHVFGSNDEADAFALCMLGLTILEPQRYEPLFTKPQLEVSRRLSMTAASLIAEHERPRATEPSVRNSAITTDPQRIAAARSEARQLEQKALF